jgi:anti-anti-sigma factor
MNCAAVIVVAGEALARMPTDVDLANAAIIGVQLDSAVPRDAAGLTVDLSSTRYIDSAGIDMLLRLAERLHWRRQTLQLFVAKGSHLARLLRIAGLEASLTIRDA